MGNVHPRDGGCWYCHELTPPLVFSCEFDTNVHEACLKEAMKNENDREASIMGAEIFSEENAVPA